MGQDWIRMRTDLYRDPKVLAMSDLLADVDGELGRYVDQNAQCRMAVTRNVIRNAVLGGLQQVWGTLRHRGKRDGDDLVVKSVTLAVLDDIADLPGFGDAMEAVGWVRRTSKGLVLPRFFEQYNSDPEVTAAAKKAARQKRYRERHSGATRGATRGATGSATRGATVAPLEKRREEKTKTPQPDPSPPPRKPDVRQSDDCRRERGKNGHPTSLFEAEPQSQETAPGAPQADQTQEGPSGTGTGRDRARKGQPVAKKPPSQPSRVSSCPVRPRNPIFDAVAEVTGLDPATAGGLLGKVSAALAGADPPYTPEEVQAFGVRYGEFCPWGPRDGRCRPTPNELQTHIGQLRAHPAPAQAVPIRPKFETHMQRLERECAEMLGLTNQGNGNEPGPRIVTAVADPPAGLGGGDHPLLLLPQRAI